MILWQSKTEREDVPRFEHTGQRSWRWVLEASRWESGLGAGIGFYHQVLFERDKTPGQWRCAGRYYDISVTPHWILGERHDYYDGPHCSFSLGFVHFNWSGDWCEKCMPSEESK